MFENVLGKVCLNGGANVEQGSITFVPQLVMRLIKPHAEENEGVSPIGAMRPHAERTPTDHPSRQQTIVLMANGQLRERPEDPWANEVYMTIAINPRM